MNKSDIIYKALEEVTGLTKEDFEDYKDINLLESGILDSMSIVSFINELNKSTGVKKLTIQSIKPSFFTDISSLINNISEII